MLTPPLTTPDKPLEIAIQALTQVINADDLRYLLAYIDIEKLDQRAEIRGIGYYDYVRGDALRQALDAMEKLNAGELDTFRLVADMMYKAFKTTVGKGRGYVEIKTITRPYPQIDFETGLQERDDNGKPVFIDFDYPYAYIRMFAGKGNADHKKQKLLCLYADRGSGKAKQGGGFGGWVAKALKDNLITEDQVLDAWHAGKQAYAEFVDGVEQVVKFMTPPKPDQSHPGQAEFPNLFE